MRVIFIAFPDNLTTLLYLFLCYCHGFQCYSQSHVKMRVLFDHVATSFTKKKLITILKNIYFNEVKLVMLNFNKTCCCCCLFLKLKIKPKCRINEGQKNVIETILGLAQTSQGFVTLRDAKRRGPGGMDFPLVLYDNLTTSASSSRKIYFNDIKFILVNFKCKCGCHGIFSSFVYCLRSFVNPLVFIHCNIYSFCFMQYRTIC